VHITGPDGKAVDGFDLPGGLNSLQSGQNMWVRQDIYNKFGNQPERMEVDYSFSLLESDPAQRVPAVDGDRRLPGVGHCATRTHELEGTIELGCLSIGNPPCIAAFLANQRTGHHNWEPDTCFSSYEPWFGHVEGDSMTRFDRTLHYFDYPADFPRHPVNQTEIQDADVMIRIYRPLAHFERKLVIPELKMSDWVTE
jgi:hypothetical protein